MDNQTIFYLVPYLISLAITCGVGVFAWRRRRVTGASPFALATFGQALWTLGYIFELLSPGLQAKIFWDDFQLFGGAIYALGFLAFARGYTGREFSNPRRAWALLALIPAIYILLAYTDRWHGLIRPEAWLIPAEPFSELVYDFTLATWVAFIYTAGLHLFSLYILVTGFLDAAGLYRRQVGLIVAGALIPLIGTTLTILGVTQTFHRDTTPLTFAISNLIIAWGLFRLRLFDVVPVARDAVIENMRDMLVVLDNQDRVVDLNGAARQVLVGQSSVSIIGQPAAEVFAPWPNLLERYRDVEEVRAEISTGEGENQHFFELNISPIRDRSGNLQGRLILIHEITERVRAERELEATNKELESFAYSVSHDLRAPLRAIDGYSQALLEDYEATLDDMGKAYLQYVRESSHHMSQLIDDLLRLSRIMRSEIRRTQVDLSAMAAGIAEALQKAQPEHQVDFVITESMLVNADPNLIQIAMQNLLDNAWKFTSKHPTARIEVGSIEQGEARAYYVRDDGAGFDMAYSDKLFDPFQRLHGAHEFEGSGIGLATVQRIIKRHNGRVWAEGAVEGGATFYFTLG